MTRNAPVAVGLFAAVVSLGAGCSAGTANPASTSPAPVGSVKTATNSTEAEAGTDSPVDSEASAPATSSTPTTASRRPEPVIDVRVAPGTASGFVGARADATLGECSGGKGRWGAAGTVTNPTTSTVDYRIYVAFLDNLGATAALTEVDVPRVPGGKTATWNGSIPLNAVDLHCVLRVERTPR